MSQLPDSTWKVKLFLLAFPSEMIKHKLYIKGVKIFLLHLFIAQNVNDYIIKAK